MEQLPKKTHELADLDAELLNNEPIREIAIMALISAVKERENYASGQDFPNIPFGD